MIILSHSMGTQAPTPAPVTGDWDPHHRRHTTLNPSPISHPPLKNPSRLLRLCPQLLRRRRMCPLPKVSASSPPSMFRSKPHSPQGGRARSFRSGSAIASKLQICLGLHQREYKSIKSLTGSCLFKLRPFRKGDFFNSLVCTVDGQ